MPQPIAPRPPQTRSPLARSPLPASTVGLPPLEPGYQAVLDQALEGLGLDLSPGAREAIADQVRLLLAWNAAINLTAVRDPEAIAREHVVDSLTAAPVLRRLGPPTPSLLDLGSGAGYPGLPLGLALGARRVGLVESIGKKARFLAAGVAAARTALLAQGEVPVLFEVLADRAETLAADPAQRGRWDFVTVRAVGPLERLVGLGFPFLQPGGYLVAWKRDAGDGRLRAELRIAAGAIEAAGGGPLRVEPVTVAGLEDHRLVIVARSRPVGDPPL
ncbi:MAG: 16S rRNA (guanine(527)-N(7))-methyltransferase RsmG [Candidatus Limnocylindrales bacterium]